MTSRERVRNVVNRKPADRMPLDLGATPVTGISASVLYSLRNALGLEEKPIKVIEPGQMLGYVEEDVRQALGVDTIGLWRKGNNMGLINENWKPWKMMDGTPVLMAGGFAWDTDENGNVLAYPQGDKNVPPSLKMLKGGYFFSGIHRALPFDEDHLDPIADYGEQFTVYTEDDARYLEKESKRLYEETDLAIVGLVNNGGFGDAGALTGNGLKHVQGIRSLEDWLMAHLLYPDYIHELFDYQTEIYLKNLEIYKQAVGNRIDVLYILATDYGMQTGELISPEQFRTFYKPRIKRVTEWIHTHTDWKVMAHSCGSIVNLLDDMAESGIDILNPVQCSAKGMDPQMLKDKYGDKFIFWGGGIDTQQSLPFGTPESVREEVRERIRVFSDQGGYVFNTTHNIVGGTPIENLMAMYRAVKEFR